MSIHNNLETKFKKSEINGIKHNSDVGDETDSSPSFGPSRNQTQNGQLEAFYRKDHLTAFLPQVNTEAARFNRITQETR